MQQLCYSVHPKTGYETMDRNNAILVAPPGDHQHVSYSGIFIIIRCNNTL